MSRSAAGKEISARKIAMAVATPIVFALAGYALLPFLLWAGGMSLLFYKFLPAKYKRLSPILGINIFFFVIGLRDLSGSNPMVLLSHSCLVFGTIWLFARTNYWSIGFLLIQRLIDLALGVWLIATVHAWNSPDRKMEFAVFFTVLACVLYLFALLRDEHNDRNGETNLQSLG